MGKDKLKTNTWANKSTNQHKYAIENITRFVGFMSKSVQTPCENLFALSERMSEQKRQTHRDSIEMQKWRFANEITRRHCLMANNANND